MINIKEKQDLINDYVALIKEIAEDITSTDDDLDVAMSDLEFNVKKVRRLLKDIYDART